MALALLFRGSALGGNLRLFAVWPDDAPLTPAVDSPDSGRDNHHVRIVMTLANVRPTMKRFRGASRSKRLDREQNLPCHHGEEEPKIRVIHKRRDDDHANRSEEFLALIRWRDSAVNRPQSRSFSEPLDFKPRKSQEYFK